MKHGLGLLNTADITVKRKFWKSEEIWVKTEKVKFLQVFFICSCLCLTHQVTMPLQAQHKCNVIMNNFYTWKAHSKIY